jgi:uncharacterized protein (TIGR02284 family)
MHLDVDAVRAYEEAISHIDDAAIRGRLQQYRDDHQRHVEDLRAVIVGLGGEAEEPRPDAKGMLIEGMTKLRSAMGQEQAIKAMHQNEEITNKQYRDAVEWNVPDDVREVLDRGYADEQRHMAYIEEELRIFAGSSTR